MKVVKTLKVSPEEFFTLIENSDMILNSTEEKQQENMCWRKVWSIIKR